MAGSVRARITAVAVAVVGVALLAGSIGLLTVLRSALLEGVDETARMRAGEVATVIAGGVLDPRLPVPVEEDEDDLLVQVVDRSGSVVAASPNAIGHAPIGTERLRGGDRRWTATVRGLAIDPDDHFRLLGERVETRAGPVTIYVATELKAFDDTVAAVRRSLQLGAPALLLLMAALTWVLVGRALRPVESIRSQVTEISAAALDRRVPEPAVNDEVGRLARTMNAMLARLQASSDRQRRFAADASHELRSPLASARTELEVALAHPGLTSVEVLAAGLLEENQRMERLVGDLLFLAGTEDGRMPLVEDVDVDDLVLAEVGRRRAQAGVRFDTSGVSAARIRGHGPRLGRVVGNLIDNATLHGATTVTVEVRTDGPVVELVVADDGPGIPPGDRERIFDRFTRLDQARSRSPDGGGSGLGLAIAREIVTAHGGRIWVEDTATEGAGGARFVVRLPAGGVSTEKSVHTR